MGKEATESKNPSTQTQKVNNPFAVYDEVGHAMKGLSAVQNVTPFQKMNNRSKREELNKVFITPKDLFIAYVMQHLHALAKNAGLESNHARHYELAPNKWDSLDWQVGGPLQTPLRQP